MANPNTAAFPSAIATDQDLPVATNSFTTTLATSINEMATSVVGLDFSDLLVPCIIKIDDESILATGKSGNTLSSCIRGFDDTPVSSHTSGTTINCYVTAWHFNQMAAEIKAIEDFMGVDGGNLALTSDLSGYVTTSALTSALSSYVSSASLTSTLSSYVTASSLTSTLSSYALTSALSSYLTTASAASTYVAIGDSFVSTRKVHYVFKGASQIAGVAALGFETAASGGPTATVVAGSNVIFATAAFGQNGYVQDKIYLPSDWTSTIDIHIIWRSTATTGNVTWQFATAGSASGASLDPSFNAANTVTTTAQGSAGVMNTSSIVGVTTTGLTAGGLMFFKLSRGGSDTMAGTADLISLTITIRRSF